LFTRTLRSWKGVNASAPPAFSTIACTHRSMSCARAEARVGKHPAGPVAVRMSTAVDQSPAPTARVAWATRTESRLRREGSWASGRPARKAFRELAGGGEGGEG
jgi:hypothetical protein